MTVRSGLRALLAALPLWGAGLSAAQPQEVVLFDEASSAGATFFEQSIGFVEEPDELTLLNSVRLPLERDHAFSGDVSGLLEYRHEPGGFWMMHVRPSDESTVDLRGFDSLIVHVNGPASIPGREMPRIILENEPGAQRIVGWLDFLRNVRVDEAETGFTPESNTNAAFRARYVSPLPAEMQRPGYPENLLITFADEPRDTSIAGIGAPAKPVHFDVRTESGMQLDFRFRDVDDDNTLSAPGEYVEILTPTSEGSEEQSAAWRIETSDLPDPLVVPGAGDVFRLAVAFDEFVLDDDPETWQRLSLPLNRISPNRDEILASVAAIVFTFGGPTDGLRTLWFDRIVAVKNDDEAFLEMVQRATFEFFWQETNPSNGLVRDRTNGNYSSIAAVGFALSAYTVAIDRGWITREQGIDRVLTTLRFFWNAPQSTATDATGYKGFFYHFLNMDTGRRSGTTELSTIDTALLIGGVMHMRTYFTGDHADEVEIRELADAIYERVDWQWAQVRYPLISHGWRPETGFIVNYWIGYNEAMILYILALGSPTFPVGPDAWDAWVAGYGGQWQTQYGYQFLTFPPLFGHQYSHIWIDFRGIQDEYMRGRGIDYFENSRRATLAQRAYHIANPGRWPNYGPDEWGLTASDTPTGYFARGAPPAQRDEGTIAPTAPGGSMPFAPEETIAALRTMHSKYPALWGPYGFRDAYNVSANWFAQTYLGIDQGPILLMIENHRTESIWDSFMTHPAVIEGLIRAGFTGEVLSADPDVEQPLSSDLTLYPNPTSDELTISLHISDPARVRVSIFDVLGRQIGRVVDRTLTPGDSSFSFDARSLAAGIYYVRVEAGDTVTTRSFVRIN